MLGARAGAPRRKRLTFFLSTCNSFKHLQTPYDWKSYTYQSSRQVPLLTVTRGMNLKGDLNNVEGIQMLPYLGSVLILACKICKYLWPKSHVCYCRKGQPGLVCLFHPGTRHTLLLFFFYQQGGVPRSGGNSKCQTVNLSKKELDIEKKMGISFMFSGFL